ncbi:MAG: YggU family protein [Pedosphaera sp.]|nr:YggU family protein [Pedosphaera sp.]
MNPPAYLRSHQDGVLLAVKLQPRASKNEIGEAAGSELKIRVTAPPVDSAANQALVDLLARTLNCPRSAMQLIRGQTSRHKTIQIHGMSVEAFMTAMAGSK